MADGLAWAEAMLEAMFPVFSIQCLCEERQSAVGADIFCETDGSSVEQKGMVPMTPYIPIICFVCGILTGVAITCLGLWLGFRASYDIRNAYQGTDDGGGVLKPQKVHEFDLIDKDDED